MSQTNGNQVSALQGLASIIIPCCGMLEYTKMLTPSLLRHTREPFELIFIDIGSLDGTADYLAGMAAAARCHVEVVHTDTDLGIPEAVGGALYQAKGEFIILLNNDTIVTDSWLQQFIGLANMSPAVGLVGPMSNYAAPPQLVESVPYRIVASGQRPVARNEWRGASGEWREKGRHKPTADACLLTPDSYLLPPAALDAFARDWREKHRGKWLEVERLGGFCLLMKRQLLTKIGEELESWSDLGLFDTDILSTKARQAGFTLAVCRDLFIHHFGTRTFAHGGTTGAGASRLGEHG